MHGWLLGLLTLGTLLLAGPEVAQGDMTAGRPGVLIALAPVNAGHWNPCAPGGLSPVIVPGYPCWQAALTSAASPVVGRSARLPRRAQHVTLTRRIYRTWLPTDPFQLSVERSVTRRITARQQRVTFPAWSEVTDTGFGYHTIIYTLAWRSADDRRLLGTRSFPVDRYSCQTGFPCTVGSQWVWLGDPD